MPPHESEREPRFARIGEILEAEVDNEIVALNVKMGQCYGFNEVATRIWQLLEEPQSIQKVSSALQEEFEVEAATSTMEVERLFSELESEGLIVRLSD